MSRFKPHTPKWREHATPEEIALVDGCDLLIKARKADLASARKFKADQINAVNARAKAHAGREGR